MKGVFRDIFGGKNVELTTTDIEKLTCNLWIAATIIIFKVNKKLSTEKAIFFNNAVKMHKKLSEDIQTFF